ncbi:hypothetical protein BO94DRAFT_206838 [Aspergillus sclerotioniger CBS 115572]|uniref:Xylanolytic transcriptional activator regulatory domain-containing protein n=1 Tax=Aspergillus sclerotioniger CBS 115572 TaxID=1450535 RepID=A0A317VU83_9EURO|nr:hypothetical protein BO94DRAFT_206838 [Aspergillus sclerotioniger CBS 115572]PWY76512.1 hypothetical protein BO94DRAFT_206838 [Aspergillus sclerotioniger CBS 115572]
MGDGRWMEYRNTSKLPQAIVDVSYQGCQPSSMDAREPYRVSPAYPSPQQYQISRKVENHEASRPTNNPRIAVPAQERTTILLRELSSIQISMRSCYPTLRSVCATEANGDLYLCPIASRQIISLRLRLRLRLRPPKNPAAIKRPTTPKSRPTTRKCNLPETPCVETAIVSPDWPQEVLSLEGPFSSSWLEDPISKPTSTSWGSIFSEFNIDVEPEFTILGPTAPGLAPTWKDPDLLQHATTVLTQIPPRAMCEGALEHALKYPDFGCHEPYLRMLHDGWWETFEGYLEAPDPGLWNSLEPVIEQLSASTVNRATTTTTQPPYFDPAEWLQMWTGFNTTWDSLAYLLSAYGSACASLPSSHPLLAGEEKSRVCRALGKVIKACLAICESQEVFSVDLINAHASMVLLQNSYDGDDSKQNYTNVGHLARLVTDMGLHLGSSFPGGCFIQEQLEHKAFHRAFTMDKSISTSCGRPPQLTRRFNQCPLPLELSDEQLLLPGDELEVVLGLLDPEGWSTGECSYPVSYLRALSLLGRHREEILELAMGPSSGALEYLQRYVLTHLSSLGGYIWNRGLADPNRDIVNRLQATYTSLPLRLQYDANHHTHLAPFDLLNTVFLHLEYHKNIFLLYRLSRTVPLSQNRPLLSSAKAIINAVTMLYTYRDRLGEMFLFFPWAVMFYGTPAAAILAIELLIRPPPWASTGPNFHPRSEIIQELSVFISCLMSIPTAEGNHAPCRRVASTLRKILDQVLEPVMSTTSSGSNCCSSSSSTTTPGTDVDSAIGLDIDWQVFVTGPCDPDYTQWLDVRTWMDMDMDMDLSIPLDLDHHGLDAIASEACFDDLIYT